MVLAAARIAAAAQAWIVWLMCVVVTYDVDSWINRGASRPAFAGSISPECDILRLFVYYMILLLATSSSKMPCLAPARTG